MSSAASENIGTRPPVVELRDVHLSYPGAARPALQGISLELRGGDFMVVLGPNGSGKTTLLNVLAGDVNGEMQGEILWHGSLPARGASSSRTRALSRVYQDPRQGSSAHLTIREHCDLSLLARGKKPVSWHQIESALKSAGALMDPDQQARTLSGGQRQLFTLLLCVLSEPQFLLLDEPTASLDQRYTELVLATIENYASDVQHVTVMVTHDLEQAIQHGNRILVLDDQGRVAADVDRDARESVTREDLVRWLIASPSLKTPPRSR